MKTAQGPAKSFAGLLLFPTMNMTAKPIQKASIKSSLQTRLIIHIVALLSLTMLVTTYVGIRRESRSIQEQMQKDGIALAMAYGTSIENALLLGSAGLSRLTGVAGRTRGINYLMVVDTTRTIIGHTNVGMIGKAAVHDALLRQALETPITGFEKNKKPTTDIGKDSAGKSVFKVAIPLIALGTVKGALEIELDMTGIADAIAKTNRESLLIALIGIFCAGIYIWIFSLTLTRPIKRLMTAARTVASGDLTQTIPVRGKDEIGHLANSFNYMTEKLRDYTRHLSEQARLQAELDTAHGIQQRFTPQDTTKIPRIAIKGVYFPAHEVGGDYLDYFETNQGNWVIVIADVCGKGVPAALFMVMLRSAFRLLGRNAISARDLLCDVNNAMIFSLDEKSFVTVLCLLINKDGTSMTCARAGHPMPVCMRGPGQRPVVIKTTGLAMGISSDAHLFTQTLTEETVSLEKGNFFLIYTDGLTEAINPVKDIYGTKRLFDVLTSGRPKDPESLVQTIMADVKTFTQGTPPHDDLTMLAMQVL
jgi:serine phosphatase RsbU (regulator of sigma subunit)